MDNEITTPLTPREQFEKNITERIEKDIGSLIPDDVLAQMVQEAIDKAFNQTRKLHGSYGTPTESMPWILSIVKDIVEPKIAEHAHKWLDEHPDVMLEVIEKVVDDGLIGHMVKVLDDRVRWKMQGFFEQLNQGVDPNNIY